MRKVFSAPTLASVGLRQGLLEENGIPCLIRNEQITMMAGVVPVHDIWPELWVWNEDDLVRAQELLARWETPDEALSEHWVCLQCGEELEGQFTACWNCAAPRPETSATP